MANRSGLENGSSSKKSVKLNVEEAKRLLEGVNAINSVLSRFVEVNSDETPQSKEEMIEAPGRSGACNRALQALRSVRQHVGGGSSSGSSRAVERDKVRDEQKKNFAPYSIKNAIKNKGSKGKERIRSCSFKTVCLNGPQVTHVPCTVAQKETLLQAGLGPKTVLVSDSSCSKEMFWSILCYEYPKLADCGGFELLRCVGTSKELEPISRSVTRSPKLLKAVIGNCKVYIRPLQKELDLEVEEGWTPHPSDSSENCIYCGETANLSSLRQHANHCRQKQEYGISDHEDNDFLPKSCLGKQSSIVISSSSDMEDEPTTSRSGDSTQQQSTCKAPETEIKDQELLETECMIDHALESSIHGKDEENSERDIPTGTLKSILTNLRGQLKSITHIPIRREYVLQDALRTVKRASFCCCNKVLVEFLGEVGADGGGPGREFWCCLAKDIQQSLCEGDEENRVFRHNAVALQVKNTFYHVVVLMAMSLLNGGSGFPYFAKSTYQYVCGVPVPCISVQTKEIASSDIQVLLDKIESAEDTTTLQQICGNDLDVIMEAGYVKPIVSISLSNKVDVLNSIKLHYGLLRVKAELDQLIAGLSVMGVGEAIRTNSDLFSPLFMFTESKMLTADYIRSLFGKTYYSEKGCNERKKEESTYMLFIDFLYGCENTCKDCTLKNVLSFFTATEIPPPLGFDVTPSLRFNETLVYPTASTCALQLTLPTRYHNDEEQFQDKMVYGILNHGGFGFC